MITLSFTSMPIPATNAMGTRYSSIVKPDSYFWTFEITKTYVSFAPSPNDKRN